MPLVKRFFVCQLLAFLIVSNVSAEFITDGIKAGKYDISSNDHARIIDDLLAAERSDRSAFESGNLDYLTARHAELAGNTALSLEMFSRVAARSPVLRPYALMHLSQLMRASGNFFLERIYLTELVFLSPTALPASGARRRLASMNIETGNYTEAIRLLTKMPSRGNARSPLTAAILRTDDLLLAEAYVRSEQTQLARPILIRLIDSPPVPSQPDDAAMMAARYLDTIDGIASLSLAEHQKRAAIFQFCRQFDEAKLHYEAVIAGDPAAAAAADAAFQIGRGYAQRFDFVEAIKWYERVLERYPESLSAPDAMLQAAAGYSRVGKAKEALTRYQAYIEKYPASDKLDRAYLNIVDVQRDLGEDQDALKWAAKTEAAFADKPVAAVAVFAAARVHIARSEWAEAFSSLERLTKFSDLGSTIPGGTSKAEVDFLRAYCLEMQGRFAEAVEAYLSIPDGREEYYGWRATERLRGLAAENEAKPFLAQKLGHLTTAFTAKDVEVRRLAAQGALRLADLSEIRAKAIEVLRTSVRSLPKYALPPAQMPLPRFAAKGAAAELLALGLYDEAVPEADAAGSFAENNFAAAEYYRLAGRVERSLGSAESAWKKVPRDFPIELIPQDQRIELYPAPYRAELLRYAKPRGVDPRLMLALMRQESRFRPEARSDASARGLMQFIATTADKLASKLDRPAFEQNELFFPPTSILFGSQYISDLDLMFPNEPEAVAASYNGGEENVKRWLARSRVNVPERYLPEIVFVQSKDYAVRVMANYRMYKLIYTDDLRPN